MSHPSVSMSSAHRKIRPERGLVFYLDPKAPPALATALPALDRLIDAGLVLKSSRTTTASIIRLDAGHVFFIKRENNKGWYFTLKYLFRKARVFRAAAAAEQLERLQILTPHVVGVGARRRWGVLQSGYLITDALEPVLTSAPLCRRLFDEPDFLAVFAADVCRQLAAMHDCGIRHGDLKISNIYGMDQGNGFRFGFWDLDGVTRYARPLTDVLRHQEVGRLLASMLKAAQTSRLALPPAEALTDAMVAHYNAHYPVGLRAETLERFIARYL